jgi:hypothetical protein
MEKREKQDEIDLFDLLLKAVNIFRANLKTIALYFLTGCLLGTIYYMLSPRIYESKLIVSSTILTESYARKLVEVTRTFIGEGNYPALSAQLGLSEAEARTIFVIRIENLSDLQTDVSKENDRYLITVHVSDQSVLAKLQQGIINYFENNEFVKIRVAHNKNFLRQMIAKLQSEIKDLEDLKIRIQNGNFFESARGNVSFDPTTVNSKILELTEKRINLENSLEVANSVHVIEEFNTFEKPIQPKLSLSLVAGSTLGLIFAAIFIGFKIIRKTLQLADAAKQTP